MTLHSRRECLRSVGVGLASCAAASVCSSSAFATAFEDQAGLVGGSGRTVVIPAGNFLMGTTTQEVQNLANNHGYHASWFDGELPQRSVYVPSFSIQVYPVTNRDFALFCAATGYPPRSHWPGGRPSRDMLTHPVTHVSQSDARAYATWIGMRLPTEAEWEKAARGVNGRTWPWGSVFDPDACRWSRDPAAFAPGTAPVFVHRNGASPYGVVDMIGNVGEWCGDGPGLGTAYIKGGAWISREVVNLRPAARNMSGNVNNALAFYGFRCARSLP